MLTRVATTNRAGIAGVFAIASAFLTACAGPPETFDIKPDLGDTPAQVSRQVAVTVGLDGALAWEGRAVTREELGDLMRDAALTSPQLLLAVMPASEEVMYGDVVAVMQMAQSRGIATKLAEPRGGTE